MADRFDVVVIGSGPGGYTAAVRAAQLGLSTAIVEKGATLGGTCLNIGCIPSKALLDSSELYETTRLGLEPHGIKAGSVSLDLAAMMARKDRIVKTFTDGVATLMKENSIAVFHGAARFAPLSDRAAAAGSPHGGPHRIEIPGSSASTAGRASALEAGSVILATGSLPVSLPFLPFDGKLIVSSTEALSFPSVPARLLVVGAGAIGLEMGSLWSRLGSKVTVVELTPQILPGWDLQIAKTLARLLARQGIVIHTSMSVTAGRLKGSVVELSCRDSDGKEAAFEGDAVLVAVGRRPSSEGLGLEEAGIERDRAGRVIVDGKLRTSLPGVYAIGDLVAGPMLAHKAEEEGIAAAETIAGGAGHVDYGVIPSVVYTSPEAASVGATEEKLKRDGVAYAGGSFVFRANGRALALGRPDGFVKVLSDARTDRVLGVHILGAFASDMIAEAVTVMAFDGAAEDIARIAHAHPSLPEITREAALAAINRPINAPPKMKTVRQG